MKAIFDNVKKNKLATILIAVAIIVLALLPTLPKKIISNYTIHIFVIIFLYAFWSSAHNLISGFCGQLSQGHAAYVGLGAYTTIILYTYCGITPWIGMIAGGIVGGLFSLIIGIPCFRLKGSYYTLSTVALLYVLRLIFTTETSIFGIQTNGALGMKIPWNGQSAIMMQFKSKVPYYYIIFVMMLICVFICTYIKYSKTGYYLSAINTNQFAAASLGVNVHLTKLRIGFVSAFLTGIGGGFYAIFLSAIDPNTVFSYDMSVRIMLYGVIGGRGTLLGPVLGSFILTPINEILRAKLGSVLAGISFVIYGVITMLIVVFLPNGFVGIPDLFRKKNTKAVEGSAKS